MPEATPLVDLEHIFNAGLERADPFGMFQDHVTLAGDSLEIRFETVHHQFDLGRYRRIYVFGAGKASARMAQAIEALLGERITDGIIAVKYGYTAELKRIRQVEAAHPVPDENSLRTAREIATLTRDFDESVLVVNLISGGGSALFDGLIEFDDEGQNKMLTLVDLQQTTQALLACGADITEINCLRKHISTVKGGRFVRMLYPATSINFILSDVIGDRLDAIASGLTVPDTSTFKEAWAIVQKYAISDRLPVNVRRALELGAAGQIAETPKPGDPIFTATHNVLIGSLYNSVLAAAQKARTLGYHTVAISSQLQGEARELARILLGMARDIHAHELLAPRPACLIGGGETTVTLRGSGKGGRNQEMALAFLADLGNDPSSASSIYFLSASTDGSDGPTDAAGAYASLAFLEQAHAQGLDPQQYLQDNDSYHFYEQLNGLLKTGPTGTNVCDLQIILVL